MEFEWDNSKAVANLKKHGIDFAEAKQAFYDDYAATLPDDEHSWDERRMRLIGATPNRLLVVIYVEVIADLMHIISARKPNKRERRFYYEN